MREVFTSNLAYGQGKMPGFLHGEVLRQKLKITEIWKSEEVKAA